MQINQIKQVVMDYYGLNKKAFDGELRSRNIARPRQLAMYIAYNFTKYPYQVIGNMFNRHHSTVIGANRLIEDLLEEEDFKKDYDRIIQRLGELR